MYVLNNVFDWYLLTSLASVASDDRMTFSTLLQLVENKLCGYNLSLTTLKVLRR